ncbi:hypothetical protein [Phnomibacter sp. MR]|uniref:hypothetical protein n=1 Tax=Phnomibacter sp. MR TaxID=3042318 RepID=UPI003A7FB56C
MDDKKKLSELQEHIKTLEDSFAKAIAIVKTEKEDAVQRNQFERAASARAIEKPLLEAQNLLFPKKQ